MAVLRVKINEQNKVVDASPATYAGAVDGWIVTGNEMTAEKIIELSDNLTDKRGVHLYKLVEKSVVRCTQEDMDEEYMSLPEPEPTQGQRITALEDALTAIEEGIASV